MTPNQIPAPDRHYKSRNVSDIICHVLPTNSVKYSPDVYSLLLAKFGFAHAHHYRRSFSGMALGEIHKKLIESGYTYAYGTVAIALGKMSREETVDWFPDNGYRLYSNYINP